MAIYIAHTIHINSDGVVVSITDAYIIHVPVIAVYVVYISHEYIIFGLLHRIALG